MISGAQFAIRHFRNETWPDWYWSASRNCFWDSCWRRTGQPLANSVFLLTWPASMQIYWNERERLHKKRVQLPQDWFRTQTWPPFHYFGTQIWPPWRHVKTHNIVPLSLVTVPDVFATQFPYRIIVSYPSPKQTFCPKWKVIVNVDLGEG